MRKIFMITVLAWFAIASASAQRAVIGARAPRIAGVEWISDRLETDGRAMMIEFFHSSNRICRERIDICHRIASRYADSLNVVIVAREPEEQIAPLLYREYQYYYIAVDAEGDVFRAYGVPYVPYAVMVDRRGVIRWTGNPETLDETTIRSMIK